MNKLEKTVDDVFNSVKDDLYEGGLKNFKEWLNRVMEFALEDEPNFKPNEQIIKELWKFGASAGGAAQDCIEEFRKNN